MLLPLMASPRYSVFQTLQLGPPELRGLINSTLLIFFFYANYLYFIPQLYQKKKQFSWILIALVSLLAVSFLPFQLVDKIDIKTMDNHREMNPTHRIEKPAFSDGFHSPHDNGPRKPRHDKGMDFVRSFQLMESTLKFLVVLILSFLLSANKKWKLSQEEKQKAELQYLKSQVNPHFLFNTLNGIYSLSLENSTKTPDAIVRLSELMRYIITEINKDLVPLQNEIQNIQYYIDLQRLRLGNTVKVNFTKTNVNPDIEISPLLLIPFVENAFKYGVSPEIESEISISLIVSNSEIIFATANKKQKFRDSTNSTNTGLENVKRRLELAYPASHQLLINDTETDYFVELKLGIKK